MGKLKLSALLLGATLFMSLGATSLLADSKCGAGKCGDVTKTNSKCGDDKKSNSKCGDDKKSKKMKCGPGKCGGN